MPRFHIAFSLLAVFSLSLSFVGCTKLPDDMELVQLSEDKSIDSGKQPDPAIKSVVRDEVMETNPFNNIDEGNYLMLFRKLQKNKNDIYNHFFEELERSLIASEDAAIGKAENYASTRAHQRTSVVALIRLEFDQEDFAKAGDFVWQVRFAGGRTYKEVYLSSTTGKRITLFGSKKRVDVSESRTSKTFDTPIARLPGLTKSARGQ
ncbi:MAG: hypothetical protein COA78_13875 [Blastopirellula sp.]|nr:MAG: hypothetical protein COA78_13875 [Blastopirellula sp.]